MKKEKHTKVILYWDYDGEFGGERSWNNPRRGVGYQDYEGTKRIFDILDEFGLKAVFAFVGAVANKGPLPYFARDIVIEANNRGHEVASHGWQHEWIPGLRYNRLKNILTWSKETLEDAIGSEVLSFVPPWNAPTRYLRKFSLGLGEYRRSFIRNIDIPKLCEVLYEVGFKTVRLGYEPFHWTIIRWLSKGRKKYILLSPFKLKDIWVIPLNLPGGFGRASLRTLDKIIEKRGDIVVIWAHPHSLLSPGKQSEEALKNLLHRLKEYIKLNKIKIALPKDMVK